MNVSLCVFIRQPLLHALRTELSFLRIAHCCTAAWSTQGTQDRSPSHTQSIRGEASQAPPVRWEADPGVRVHRHCQGALVTLNLQPRHDLIHLALGFVTPRDDTMTLEIYMDEGAMPTTCLAVGLPRTLKHLQSIRKDLETYARPVSVATRTDIRDWPAESLSVVAESTHAFQAFFCRPVLDLAFGKEVCSGRLKTACGDAGACCYSDRGLGVAAPDAPRNVQNVTASEHSPTVQAYHRHTAPYFRWLHFSSEFVSDQGGRMRVLRFSFKLPEWNRMHELTRRAPAVKSPRMLQPSGNQSMSC